MPLKTFVSTAGAPIDAFGSELGFPRSKLVGPADVEPDVIERRLDRGARGDAVLITIRPDVSNLSIGRRDGGKSEQVTGKTRKALAVRHTDADLHDIFDRCHG